MVHRNRSPFLKNGWIFPWQTVNVITIYSKRWSCRKLIDGWPWWAPRSPRSVGVKAWTDCGWLPGKNEDLVFFFCDCNTGQFQSWGPQKDDILYWIRKTVEAINHSIVTCQKMCYRWIQMTCFPWTSRCPTFLSLGELQYVGISISPIFRDVCISRTGTVVADRSFPVSVPLLSWTQLVPRQNSKSSKRKSGSFFWNPQNDRKGSM